MSKNKYIKPEYVIIKFNQSYYYARLMASDLDTYQIMVPCSEKEAREIAMKANATSAWNKDAEVAWSMSKATAPDTQDGDE